MTGERLPAQAPPPAGARFDPFTGKPLAVQQDPGAGPAAETPSAPSFPSPGTLPRTSGARFRGPLSAHVLDPNPLKRKAEAAVAPPPAATTAPPPAAPVAIMPEHVQPPPQPQVPPQPVPAAAPLGVPVRVAPITVDNPTKKAKVDAVSTAAPPPPAPAAAPAPPAPAPPPPVNLKAAPGPRAMQMVKPQPAPKPAPPGPTVVAPNPSVAPAAKKASTGRSLWRVTDEDKAKLKGGRWNPAERELLKANIAKYGEIHNIPDVREWLSQRKGKQGGSAQSFFLEVSDGLGRPVASVYREIHRMFNNQGKGKVYTEADVKKLCELQKQHGNNWIEIGKQMDRTAESVRDRFKLCSGTSGKWSAEEETKLAELVYEMTGQTRGAKLGVGSGIPWKAIGIKMATRNEHQCMGKWYSKLEWKPATDETWKMEDNALLADNINKSAATFESDIPWKEISASFSGTYRNAWALRNKWNNIKRKWAPGHESMPFSEMLAKIHTGLKPWIKS